MSNLKGTNITKGRIGVNTISTDTGISAIIVASEAPPSLILGNVYVFYNITDVEALGIDEDYDMSYEVTVYRQLSEFYRMAGSGQKLYFMMVNRITTMVEMLSDVDIKYAKKLLVSAKGEVRQLGVSVNIDDDPIILNGMPTDVYNSIAIGQAFAIWAYDNNMPCQVLLEGHSFSFPASSCADLRDLPDLQADKVSVVIGQDYNYAAQKEGYDQLYADVGTALGTLSTAGINQNIGDNEAFDISDATIGKWLVPGIALQTNEQVFSDLQTLEDKGYIFGVTYTGLSGVRWNNDHTCTPIIRDVQGNVNEHTISYGRTLDHARRELRKVLLPKLKTKYPVLRKTGKLPVGVVKFFENICDGVLLDMENSRIISSGKSIVDPQSDLIISKTLNVDFQVQPYGSVDDINGKINLKTQL